MLIFDKDELSPDEALKLQFEAISRFDPEDKKIVQAVLVLRDPLAEQLVDQLVEVDVGLGSSPPAPP